MLRFARNSKVLERIKQSSILTKAMYSVYTAYNRGLFNAIEFETITTCNRKCSYCPNSTQSRGGHQLMDEAVFKKVIDELSEANFGGRLSPHFYGEPLLDKRLPELMAYARKKLPRANIVIYTNGDLLSPEKFEMFMEAGVTTLLVTQHGEAMSTNCTKLFEYLGDKPSLKKRLIYRRFSNDKYFQNRGGLVTVVKLEKMVFCFPKPVIDWDGNVVVCCNDYFGTIKFGNVRNESIIDIWNKENYRRMRKSLGTGNFQLKMCKICVGIEKPDPVFQEKIAAAARAAQMSGTNGSAKQQTSGLPIVNNNGHNHTDEQKQPPLLPLLD